MIKTILLVLPAVAVLIIAAVLLIALRQRVRVLIVDAASPLRVVMKLDMTTLLQAHNDIVFSLVAAGNATQVTWTMEGPSPVLGKVMGVVFNMDRMVGGAFEEGLADLKLRAEKA